MSTPEPPAACSERIARALATAAESTDIPGWMAEASGWACTPRTLRFVTEIVTTCRIKSVLEFGAGLSSVTIARALDNIGGGKLTSVDHAPQYAAKAWHLVTQETSVDARLIVRPIRLRAYRQGLFFGYSGLAAELSKRGPFDLVLVDAPPGVLGRDASLHQAWPFLSDGALIVLDDFARSREQTTVRRWQRCYRSLSSIRVSERFERGVAVFQRQGGEVKWSWRNALGSVHDLIHYRHERRDARSQLAELEATSTGMPTT